MKFDIGGLKREFMSELNAQNWLQNVGKHTNGAEIFAPFRAKFAVFKQLPALLKSDSWTNIDLEIFAEICRFSDQILRHDALINLLATAAREILSPQKEYLAEKISALNLPRETYDYSVFPIVLRAFQEFGLRQIAPNFRTDFNTNLLKILNLGYLPCGWAYDAPKFEAPYDPLTFVTDSLKRQNKASKFSYDSGVLYVY